MAGLVLEADGFHSPQQVQERMEVYGMPANPEGGLHGPRQVSGNTMLVMEWMLYVASNTYLAGAFYFPCVWRGRHGVMLCVSTPQSTALSKANANVCMRIVQNGIPRPEFLAFVAYFYEGLHFGNFRGFTDGKYPMFEAGTFEDALGTLADAAGIANWLQMLFVRDGMLIYQGLRDLLHALQIPLYAHLTSGLSWHKYAALDVYLSIHSPAMDVEDCSPAWWLVCEEKPYPTERYVPKAEDWWALYSWEPYGQRPRQLTNDYVVDLRIPRGVVEVCQVFQVNGPEDFRRMPENFQRRMRVLMGQAAPGIDWDAALAGRVPMYGLARAPVEVMGKGKGKGIRAIMDARLRPSL